MILPKLHADPNRGVETERERRARPLAESGALREQIHRRHSELTPEEGEALADGLRQRMRQLDESPDAEHRSSW
jgi:hypothetical protein